MKRKVVYACAAMFNVHPRDLVGNSRFQFLMPARFALYKALNLRGWSTAAIGRYIGRDHSTVIYGIKRANGYMAESKDYEEKVHLLADMQPVYNGLLEEVA